ncbi:hypothetical protein AOL_s00088g1 [Orbilia oligospora ATCC 24927]|uniref:C2H2-type domain-containing protein n=1 Tax=Arthrobotrys oligospora (strain ATCC 24927 / CBS 115.81 / DSM 1491) TaxID=756982 RepID=G1XHN8_ARTOA|nr:hypothetical protein AOL_s00088g1 [Orbilia oligospora ATCC 24927]EGX47286.1 hypothetical protein AOL_s00088g1 [Orbilia oligospora ATCC 24927]
MTTPSIQKPRGRGRPKKSSNTGNAIPQKIQERRGRGRPKKSSNTGNAIPQKIQERRGRGRPKKAAALESSSNQPLGNLTSRPIRQLGSSRLVEDKTYHRNIPPLEQQVEPRLELENSMTGPQALDNPSRTSAWSTYRGEEVCDAIEADLDNKLVVKRRAQSTEYQISRMWAIWEAFSKHRRENNPLNHLRGVDPRELKVFTDWYLTISKRTRKQKSMKTHIRRWRMMYDKLTGQRYQPDRDDVMDYIGTQMSDKHNLTASTNDKPIANADDLLDILYHHWHLSEQTFQIERFRIQLGLVILIACSTSCRPGSIVESISSRGLCSEYIVGDPAGAESYIEPDSIKYKDIELFLVHNEENRNESYLTMRIRVRLQKGYRNTKEPTIYSFTEVDEPLGFDVISYMLALAFDDDAFASEYIKQPEDLYQYQSRADKKSLRFHWKESVMETPLIRDSIKAERGWEISKEKGFSTQKLNDHCRKLGKELGYPRPLTMYTFRRGAGEAMDSNIFEVGKRNISTAGRCKAMGQLRPETYDKNYSPQAAPDIQSAFLGRPSKDKLIQLMNHLAFERDPMAKREADKNKIVDLQNDTNFSELTQERDIFRNKLIDAYSSIKEAEEKDPNLHSQYIKLNRKINTYREKARREAWDRAYKQYFSNNGTIEIDRQAQGLTTSEITPTVEIPVERLIIAGLLFGDGKTEVKDWMASRNRRIEAITHMVNLCRVNQPRRYKRHIKLEGSATPPLAVGVCEITSSGVENESDSLGIAGDTTLEGLASEGPTGEEPTSEKLPTNIHQLQCPTCFYGSSSFPKTAFIFTNGWSLQRHFRDQHLACHNPGTPYFCPYPSCEYSNDHEPSFKNHLSLIHDFVTSKSDTVYTHSGKL